jgi:AAA15 family ATPase/GTPase
LAEATNWNYTETRPVFKWFKEKLIIEVSSHAEPITTAHKVLQDELFSKFTKKLLHQVDLGINNFEVEKKILSIEELPEEMPKPVKEVLAGEDWISIQIGHLLDNEIHRISLSDESDGTQRIFGLSAHLYDVLRKGGILVIDELENSLHPLIVQFLVSLFADKTQNQNGAQLIFSTHNTSLLNLELFRRDQIWFTEKHPEKLNTELYSLFDIKARKDENPAKGYLMGRYGAIPVLGSGILFPVDG